jgi:hypothetical protein
MSSIGSRDDSRPRRHLPPVDEWPAPRVRRGPSPGIHRLRALLPAAARGLRVDHLIPLELDGDNAIQNLWPEAAEPRPGFHEKDRVENYLHGKVCAGEMSVGEAQRLIATDWLSVWTRSVGETTSRQPVTPSSTVYDC